MAVGERAALFAQSPWAGVVTGGTIRTTPRAPVYLSIVDPPQFMVMARAGVKPFNDLLSQTYDFFSPHQMIGYFLFADGSVHAFRAGLEVEILRARCSRAEGEPVSGGDF